MKARRIRNKKTARIRWYRDARKGDRDGYRIGWEYGYESGYKKAVQSRNSKTTKIGYVIPGCAISGGIAVICQHTNRLSQRGFDVVMITLDGQREINWYPNHVPIVSVEEAPAWLDVVVATQWSTVQTARNMQAGRKYYFIQSDESRFYDSDSESYRLALETYHSRDFTFLTMAQWIQLWLLAQFGQNTIYVPNGLDPELMHPTEPIIPRDNRVRVLLEGEISNPLKGMAEAFMAVRDLDCEVWCVSAKGKPDLSWRCDHFFESVTHDQMKSIYSSCDILLKMSRVESFMYPPLEMMACGGTVVVAEVEGIEEYIRHGYNALVVPQDVHAASQAVKLLIDDIELRRKLIQGGLETADWWNWDRAIDVLEQEFRRKV